VYVYFNISERDILTLRATARAERGDPTTPLPELRELRWPLQVGLMTEEGFPHEGVIDYADPAVDASTGTQQVRAVFENQDGALLAGLFVRVRVPLGKPYMALTVTERALGSDQGQRYLLVVNEKNVVEYRPVKVGTLQQGLRVITGGLGAQDRVIVSGIQRARPGLTVSPVETTMPELPAGAPAAAPTTAATAARTATPGH
jgi:RND family efflux transporter MFP subunit